jgi:hypothetical protein
VIEVFQVSEEGVGCGSVSGETRGKLVQAIEQTRAKLLIKALGLGLAWLGRRPGLSSHGDRETSCQQPGCLLFLSHTLLCHMRN